MRPVSYSRVRDVATAIATVTADAGAAYLAGGTTKVDMLRIYAEASQRLVDINDLPIDHIEVQPDGALRIGAMARMNDVAMAPLVMDRFPVISEALVLGASAQLRNMASMGGNMLQRTRCTYFRDAEASCNKREPGTGCDALTGVNRGHAVLGTSRYCIATHPSDVAVALTALDAVIHVQNTSGHHAYPIDDFFLLPGATPQREHPLNHGDLITAIEVPALPMGRNSLYLKVRDRESYEFALSSAACALRVEGGEVAEVRLALGGVATKPWRARRAERALLGQPATRESFARAAAEEMSEAVAQPMNEFKIELAQRTMVRALETLAARGDVS
ncbi:carbon-monoxide dehydrogenase medium subunit [Catellatospora sp. IY07-71]|uniref:FAD binding domain-containing protein n=1 Tax=Catellatospora sp. IY07-71 TaxID=2728827 RepID=UPI001BB3CD71|nr:xanthine dehydrogenase family protein subunit M [Catellatospora sp. IY07-71]BCJ75485.1 carbon-monoxide dehydrogenase medium subunit [Catellatospora sp. IY07-71]